MWIDLEIQLKNRRKDETHIKLEDCVKLKEKSSLIPGIRNSRLQIQLKTENDSIDNICGYISGKGGW